MRKLCTRQHFIEYLSYNFVEKQCLMARCLWERFQYDYGIDGFVLAVNEIGEVEDEFLNIQVKSTERLRQLKTTGQIVFDFSKRDLENWLGSSKHVVLVVYDANADTGYYLDVAKYFKSNRQILLKSNKFVRLYFPHSNVFDPKALRYFKQSK